MKGMVVLLCLKDKGGILSRLAVGTVNSSSPFPWDQLNNGGANLLGGLLVNIGRRSSEQKFTISMVSA